MSAQREAVDRIPRELWLYACPLCGKVEQTNFERRRGHLMDGERCHGVPKLTTYVWVRV